VGSGDLASAGPARVCGFATLFGPLDGVGKELRQGLPMGLLVGRIDAAAVRVQRRSELGLERFVLAP